MQNCANMAKLKYKHIYYPAFAGLWLALFVDSKFVSEFITYNQWLASVITLLFFLWVYSQVTKSIKLIMVYGLVLAALGESFFSLVLGMYTYRLENIPLYIPTGHCLFFIGTYYIMKEPLTQKYQDIIIRVLYPALIIYSCFYLFYLNDLTGFLFMLITLLVLYRYPVNKLLFLLTFVAAICTEHLGTYWQCWEYPSIWFGQFEWIPSASPPSGIGIFYSAFDVWCLWMYKLLNRQSWQRMRSIQKAANKKTTYSAKDPSFIKAE